MMLPADQLAVILERVQRYTRDARTVSVWEDVATNSLILLRNAGLDDEADVVKGTATREELVDALESAADQIVEAMAEPILTAQPVDDLDDDDARLLAQDERS